MKNDAKTLIKKVGVLHQHSSIFGNDYSILLSRLAAQQLAISY